MRHRQRGLTLIELAVVLSLAALTMTLALPALGNWIARQQLQGALDDIRYGLTLARKAATTRQKRIWVEFGQNGGGWWMKISEQENGPGCDPARDLRCLGSEQHAGISLSSSPPLPQRLAFSPLRGMPQDASRQPLKQLDLHLARAGCRSAQLTLLATGLLVSTAGNCP
ncbi:GspH/FimT family pseudopilin [Chromobacterium sp. CV08]|uniref:GspH/FimT family pseudopilin n=1 Tax=Chromobacterium sp. CV08 TaxID=3133274 RepID=UPI003DA870ED